MALSIAPRSKLLMIGDSITDCERARPVGEGLFGAIGKGYVAQVEALLGTAYPARAIRVVNMGTSGNTVRDLKSRWEGDVLALRPDWLSVMIGINDVWRQFDMPLQTETHVLIEEYARTLEELVAATRPRLKGLVLMSPFYIEGSSSDAMRSRMDLYTNTARRCGIAQTPRRCLFVDTQAAFLRLLAVQQSAALAWDRVHPNQNGHMVIARAFLDAVGFSWQGE